MLFRTYQEPDAAACLKLFDSNTPAFFAPSEREEFVAYLAEAPHYFVLVAGKQAADEQAAGEQAAGEQVVGCGGLEEIRDGIWVLCWGMVEQRLHRQGLGKALLLGRLDWIRMQPNAKAVHLDTTPFSRGFFERFGFVVTSVTPNGYGEGYDRVDMTLELV
jgi:GNAT superfamily N-acetyltransferase